MRNGKHDFGGSNERARKSLGHWVGLGLLASVLLGQAASAAPGQGWSSAARPALLGAHLSQAAKPVGAAELADRVQNFYDQSKTFQAKFKQRYFIAAYNKFKDSNGSVVFQKPGKMSWRYENNGNRVVSNGQVIKVYEQENKQMYEQSIDRSQYPAALSFLLGGGKLKKEFKLKKLDSRALGYEGGYVMMAEPKKATPAFQQMLLYIDAGTYQVRRVLMIDAQRNRNRFDFLTPVVNKPVPASEFQFTPPAGTKVIKP